MSLIVKFREGKEEKDEEESMDEEDEEERDKDDEDDEEEEDEEGAEAEARKEEWNKVNEKFVDIRCGIPEEEEGEEEKVMFNKRLEAIEQLISLSKSAATPSQKLEILVDVVYTYFGFNPYLQGHIPLGLWKNCVETIKTMFELLIQHPNIVISTSTKCFSTFNFIKKVRFYQTMKRADYPGKIWVHGDLVEIAIRMYSELYESLVNFKNEENIKFESRYRSLFYMVGVEHYEEKRRRCLMPCEEEKERCELMLFNIYQSFYNYSYLKGHFKEASDIACLLVRLLHNKPQVVYNSMLKFAIQSNQCVVNLPSSCREMMEILVDCIYCYGDEDTKICTKLRVIYHHATMDEFLDAQKILVSIGNVQEKIQDVQDREYVELLYNRAVAQLGLCAYRAGLMKEAHAFLPELFEGGRVDEKLGQWDSKNYLYEKPHEQETPRRRKTRRGQSPHKRIHLQLLESARLKCAGETHAS